MLDHFDKSQKIKNSPKETQVNEDEVLQPI